MKSSREDSIEFELRTKLINTSHNTNQSSSNNHNNSHNSRKENDQHFTQDLNKYFSLRTSKILAFSLITFFIFYHGYLNSFYGKIQFISFDHFDKQLIPCVKGRNSCNRLLGEGHVKGDNRWQPFGCMIHKYTQKYLLQENFFILFFSNLIFNF